MAGFRKRVGAPLRRPMFKRRRFIRRRRFGRFSRRVTSVSTNSTRAISAAGFRSRRIRPRVYRSMLWRDTQSEPHWRSVFSSGAVITTPNNITDSTVTVIRALQDFYTIAGGAQPIDSGVAVPNFGQDIVLRGGVCRLTLANPNPDIAAVGGGDTIRCRVFAVWTTKNTDLGVWPPSVPSLWDPSIITDFSRYFKVLFSREFMMEPNGRAFDVSFRHRLKKIDKNEFQNNNNQLFWIVLTNQITNADVLAESITAVVSHNVSFTADQL